MRILAAAIALALAVPALAQPAPATGAAPAAQAAAPAAAAPAWSAKEPAAAPAAAPAPAKQPAAIPSATIPLAPQRAPATEAPAPRLRAPGYGKTEGLIPGWVIGPKLALIQVPAPGIGLESKFHGVLGLSFDYDLFPTLSSGPVKVGYTDWNLAAKWYPWRGSFFLGAAYGSRSFKASALEDLTGLEASVEVKSTYLAPELGWRWVWNSGVFLGLDLGYQMILSTKTTVTLPFGIGGETTKDVTDSGNDLGKIGFPIISLLQIGYFF